jgi:heme-degrading monooxygenase HmoA
MPRSKDMTWMRLSLFRPIPGRKADVDQTLTRLEELLSRQRGFVMASHFVAVDESGDMGRMSFWESADDANHASADEDVQAIRSQLNLNVQPGHTDYLCEIQGTPRGSFPGG